MFKIFQRPSIDERRPHQFIKRHSFINSTVPSIDLDELAESERLVYESWWRDLDPFNLQKINNQTIFKFLSGCSLDYVKLAKILVLFESAQDELTKYQFFAMLRLIAHAQNGRKTSRALVYLGAPIAHFQTNAIDALLVKRKSWWGQQIDEDTTTTTSPVMEEKSSHTRTRSASESNPYHHQPQRQALLLTQKFVYQSPPVRHTNPFQADPFDDENSSSDDNSPIYHPNQKPNQYNIPPPPVPSQFTKPAFPKYTRNFGTILMAGGSETNIFHTHAVKSTYTFAEMAT